VENGKVQVGFYGGARDFINYRGHESILHGPAETGKTFSALYYLHLAALKHPNASIVIARKVLNDIYASIWQTYYKKIIRDFALWPCQPYGGLDKPNKINYNNGATLWFAGFDRPGKVLSAEHDIIFIVQVEECNLEDWETATTRTTGRAGNMPYSRTMGDANPGWPSQWMYNRDSLKIFYSKHEENPTLYDPATGAITEQGERTMAILHALTGVRRTRLLLGKPDRPEGIIFEDWNESKHLIYEKDVPPLVRYVAAQDWGYTNPGCLGVWGLDGDDNMYLVAQVYHSRQLNEWWVERVVELGRKYPLEVVLCDPSQPEYIARYRAAGINAQPAYNAVGPGIDGVNTRIARNGLFIVRDSLLYPDEVLKNEKRPHRVEDELPGYVWANTKAKEIPVKENDHGCDMTRYAVAYVDNISSKPPLREMRPWR